MTTQSTNEASLEARIPRRWLPAGRLIWLALALLAVAVYIAGLSPYYSELLATCSGEACSWMALSPREAEVLRELGLSIELYAGYLVGLEVYTQVISLSLAGLVFWRRSDSWMGILVSLTLVNLGVTGDLPLALLKTYPQLSLPISLLDAFALTLFVLLVYLFPDGSFVPRWTRLVAAVFLGALLIELILTTFCIIRAKTISNSGPCRSRIPFHADQ